MTDLPKHQQRVLDSLARSHPLSVGGVVAKFAEPLRRKGLIEDTSGYPSPPQAMNRATSSYRITPAGLELAATSAADPGVLATENDSPKGGA